MEEDTRRGSPPREAVEAELDRMLSADAFARSARGRALLRYVVTEALEGRGARISATTIAQDVLGKDETFDSGSDPLVRVQMGRLRALLEGWYESEGRDAAVRIAIPKGTYCPVFTTAPADGTDEPGADTEPPAPAPAPAVPAAATGAPAVPARARGRRPPRFRLRPGHLAAAGLVAVVGALVFFGLGAEMPRRGGDYPVVVVRPFENLTGLAANDALSAGLQRQLAADLQRFRTVRVAMEGAGPRNQEPSRMAARRAPPPEPDYALTGTILSATDELDFTVDVLDLGTGDLIERRRVRGEADGDYFALLAELSQTATGRIAGGGGAVARDRLEVPGEGGMGAFRCFVTFQDFVRARTAGAARQAHDCLTRELAASPNDSTMLAALAWTEALIAPEAGQIDAGAWAEDMTLEGALQKAERAVGLDPGDDFAHEYLALLQWRMGQKQAAIQSLRRALTLNPGNPDLYADLGLYLGFTGRWEQAERMNARAYERSADPPTWYALPGYYRAVLDGDGEAAMAQAEIAAPGDPYGAIYRMVAAVIAGDAAAVEAEREAVETAARRYGGDPLAPARPWIRSEEVLDALDARLAEAGVGVAGS